MRHREHRITSITLSPRYTILIVTEKGKSHELKLGAMCMIKGQDSSEIEGQEHQTEANSRLVFYIEKKVSRPALEKRPDICIIRAC